MPNDPSSQPTQPLTDEELEVYAALVDVEIPGTWSRSERNALIAHYITAARRLLPEVSRLRAENTAQAAKLAEIEKTWRAAELAWFAGVTVERQLPIVMKQAAAMRSALGLDQDGRGEA